MGRPAVNRTGKRYGKWVVLSRGQFKAKTLFWNCQCDCGTVKEVAGSNLHSGQSTSCGCDRIAKVREATLGQNYGNEFDDLMGRTFNRWTIIGCDGGKPLRWKCQCSCGTIASVLGQNLKRGLSKSCGCLQIETNAARWRHGSMSNPLYRVWIGMRNRCNNPNADDFKYYGGRGIAICERWLVFENFETDMSPTYRHGLTIERINVNAGYCLENCTWVTQAEQLLNTRRSLKNKVPPLPKNFLPSDWLLGSMT